MFLITIITLSIVCWVGADHVEFSTQEVAKTHNLLIHVNCTSINLSLKTLSQCLSNLPPLEEYRELNAKKVYLLHRSDDNEQHIPEKHVPTDHVSVKDWQSIGRVLNKSINAFSELESVLKTLNPWLKHSKFEALENLLESLDNEYFWKTIDDIRCLALKLPNLLDVSRGVPLLSQNIPSILFLSQLQIASLLANAFFNVFPFRGGKTPLAQKYPTINFDKLFVISRPNELSVKTEKLKCLFNYFSRIARDRPEGVVSFERIVKDQEVKWKTSSRTLKRIYVRSGLIEDGGRSGFAEVDFANRRVGGGVLNTGAVQEEIRFVSAPELIAARLFTQSLLDNEALVVTGAEQFNSCSGYSKKLKFEGNFVDKTPRDTWNRRMTRIIAIDALNYRLMKRSLQFEQKMLRRELNKAVAGFSEDDQSLLGKSAVASGKWGCGAFQGDHHVKTLIQIMAASQTERDLVFYPFDDSKLGEDIKTFVGQIHQKNVVVSDLFRLLLEFADMKLKTKNAKYKKNVFDFICERI